MMVKNKNIVIWEKQSKPSECRFRIIRLNPVPDDKREYQFEISQSYDIVGVPQWYPVEFTKDLSIMFDYFLQELRME